METKSNPIIRYVALPWATPSFVILGDANIGWPIDRYATFKLGSLKQSVPLLLFEPVFVGVN